MALTSFGFDESFYLSQNPDVLAAILNGQFENAEQHFQLFGYKELRDPSASFDTSVYLTQNPDVLAAGVNPLDHFINFGAKEGRVPGTIAALSSGEDFDEDAYLAANSDVKDAVDAGGFASGYQHWVLYGQFESRSGAQTDGGTALDGSTGAVGTTFALTNSSTTSAFDNLTGTVNNDTFQALAFGSLEDGDVVNGGSGTDTINARFDASAAGQTDLTLNTSLSSVENVNITVSKEDDANDNIAVDTSSMSGLENIVAKDDVSNTAGDVLYTFNNVATGVKAGVSGGASGADVTVAYKTTAGTQSETFTVADSAKANIVTIAGIETLTVEATGTGNVIENLNAADATKLNVTGTGAVSIDQVTTNSTNVTEIDASANTGGVTVGKDAALATGVTKFTGGTGNDALYLTATNVASSDAFDGGDGTDTVFLAGGALGSAHASITNFETLGVADTGSTYDLSKLTGSAITAVNVSTTGGTVGVTSITDQTVSFTGSAPTTVTLGAAAADSTVSVVLDNGTGKNANGVDIGNLEDTNIKVLNVTSNDDNNSLDTDEQNSISGIDVETVNLTATAATLLNFAGTVTKTVDASASTADVQITGTLFSEAASDTGATITTGSGADNTIDTDEDDTINTGAGKDTVTLSTGDDTVDLGSEDDIIIVSAANLTSADTINGGDGTDTLRTNQLSDGDNYDLSGANSSKLSKVSSVEKIEIDAAGLNAGEKATLTIDDATMSVAGNALTLSSTNAASATAISEFNASSVVLSTGTIALNASSLTNILAYLGGNATETVTGSDQDDTFTYETVSYLGASDAISGGSGADTLTFSGTGAKTITDGQLAGVSSVGKINLDGVTGANANDVKITLSASVATAMAESNALTIESINAAGNVDDTGKITIDGSTVGSGVALTLQGADGEDVIKGGSGDDEIIGETGADELTGGSGKDDFHVSADDTAMDVITDFDWGAATGTTTVDQIQFNADFLGAANGADTNGDFTAAAKANNGTASVDTGSIGANIDGATDIAIITDQTYANAAAVDLAVETLAAGTVTQDFVLVYQDSFGSSRIAVVESDGVEDGADFTVTDIAKLDGVGISGIASLIDSGDFIFA